MITYAPMIMDCLRAPLSAAPSEAERERTYNVPPKNCEMPPAIISAPTARFTMRLQRERGQLQLQGPLRRSALPRLGVRRIGGEATYKMSERSMAMVLERF